MEHLLLILVLIGDPSGSDIAKGVAEELVRRGGDQVQVLTGEEARAALGERGIGVKDLLIAPNIGQHLTAPGSLVVLHVDRTERGGDVMVETKAWFSGRADSHMAIAGQQGDPTPAVAAGVVEMLGEHLPGNQVKPKGPPDDLELALMAERKQWIDLLARMAGVQAHSPRQRYYEVLAYAKLGQRDPAVDALNHLREEHPGHFLIDAAAELIPPRAGEEPQTIPDDGSGNTLRDDQ